MHEDYKRTYVDTDDRDKRVRHEQEQINNNSTTTGMQFARNVTTVSQCGNGCVAQQWCCFFCLLARSVVLAQCRTASAPKTSKVKYTKRTVAMLQALYPQRYCSANAEATKTNKNLSVCTDTSFQREQKFTRC